MKWGKKDMQSKTSLFKKELLIQNFRSVGWVGLSVFDRSNSISTDGNCGVVFREREL